MQPPRQHWYSFCKKLRNFRRTSIFMKSSLETKGLEGAYLRLGVGGVAVFRTNLVVGVVAGDLAVIAGHHCCTGAETLAVAGARGVVVL